MSVTTPIDDPEWTTGGFQYSDGWGLGQNIPEHYGGTGTYSNVPGSQAVLFFSGTSITYYGDRQRDFGLAKVSIDGQPATTVNLNSATQQYRVALWMKDLADGDHQLVIEHGGPQQTNIMIDYVSIKSNSAPSSSSAGPYASIVPSNATLVDSNDPQLVFSGIWRVETAGLFFNKSRQTTQTPGASVRFAFNGTGIWYFSNMGPEYGNVQINLDGDSNNQGASASSQNSLNQKLIWGKSDLQPGTHSITITHSDTSGKYAALDFFRYVPSEGSPPGSGTNTSPGNDSGGASSQNSAKRSATGAIVGGTVGGVALLAALMLCLFLWRRRRNRQTSTHPPSSTAVDPTYASTAFSPTKDSSTRSDMLPTENIPPLSHTIPRGYALPNNRISELYPAPIRAAGSSGGYVSPIRSPSSIDEHTLGYSPPVVEQHAIYAPAPVPEPRKSPVPEIMDERIPDKTAEIYTENARASGYEFYSPSIIAAGTSSQAGPSSPSAGFGTIQPVGLRRGSSMAPSAPPAYDKK